MIQKKACDNILCNIIINILCNITKYYVKSEAGSKSKAGVIQSVPESTDEFVYVYYFLDLYSIFMKIL